MQTTDKQTQQTSDVLEKISDRLLYAPLFQLTHAIDNCWDILGIFIGKWANPQPADTVPDVAQAL
ncbi:MAG: hypothetical protein AAGA46_02545, partial [Cyanobacteria bacterium P01_F01_bin.13]